MAADPRWLERVPRASARLWLIVALLCLPVLPAALLLAPARPGSSDGGWTVPAVIYAFWEPLLAWGIILSLLIAFQRRFADWPPVWQRLSRRAFTIYIIHPPVLVGIALAILVAGGLPLLSVAGARALLLGPEPIIGPQAVVLASSALPGRSLRVATDGLRPFAVAGEQAP